MQFRQALGVRGGDGGGAGGAAVVLAPMVRLGTLPLRLLSLQRGARLVYTEEICDAKLAQTTRSFDPRLGTTDWRGAGGQCVLRTCDAEAGRLVVQLGTSGGEHEELLVAAAEKLIDREGGGRCHHHGIVGVDLNMGCPKRSAHEGGSGVALFADRARCESAVRCLRRVLPPSIAVTCKVRLCEEGGVAASLERVRGLVAAGAGAICVHARRPSERPSDPSRWAELATIHAGLRNARCGSDVGGGGAVARAGGSSSSSRVAAAAAAAAAAAHRQTTMLAPRGVRGRASVSESRPVLIVNGDAVDEATVAELWHAATGTTTCTAGGHPGGGSDGAVAVAVAVGRGALLAGTAVFGDGGDGSGGGSVLIGAGHTAAAAAAAATLSLCRHYCRIAIDVENPPLNTAFVLQWMLHAASREASASASAAALGAAALAPPSAEQQLRLQQQQQLQRAAAALRRATSVEAVAEAVGLGGYYRRVTRGTPAPPSHRYRADYFDGLSGADWAAAPTCAAMAEARAARAAMQATPRCLRRNADFRRLAAATAALQPRRAGGGGEPAPPQTLLAAAKKRRQPPDWKAVLSWHLATTSGGGNASSQAPRPRYFVLSQVWCTA
jgi:tRNA-dihydrouridine synthase